MTVIFLSVPGLFHQDQEMNKAMEVDGRLRGKWDCDQSFDDTEGSPYTRMCGTYCVFCVCADQLIIFESN